MGQARDEAGNIWETDAQGNAVRLIQAAGVQQGVIYTPPPKQKEPPAGYRFDGNGNLVAIPGGPADKPNDPPSGYRWGKNGNLEPIPGGPADKSSPQLTPAQLQDQKARKTALDNLVAQINRVQTLGNQGPLATKGIAGIQDYNPWSGANAQFDTAGAQLSQQGLAAFRVPGTGTVSDRDAAMFDRGNLPQASNLDASNQEILHGLRSRVEGEYAALGLPAPKWEGVAGDNNSPPITPWDQESAPPGSPTYAAATGSTRTVKDSALSGTLNSMFAQGASLDDINAYLGTIPGAQKVNPVDYANMLDYARKHPGYEPFTATRQEPLTMRQKISGSAPAAGVAGVADAASFGALTALAPGQMAALSNTHPGAMLGGEVIGSIYGSKGIGALGRFAAAKLPAGWAAKVLANTRKMNLARNVATDAAYGGIYNGVANGDPVTGALAGAGGSILGQGAGKVIGAGIGGVSRLPAVETLRKMGVEGFTTGQQVGGILKSVEDRAMSTPVIGDMIRNRRLDNLRSFNNVALNQAGEPIGAGTMNVGERGLADIMDATGTAYDNAVQGVRVPLDPQFTQDLRAVAAGARNLPPDLAPRFAAAMDNRVGPIAAANELTGETYQQAMRGLKGYKAEVTKPGFEQDYRDALTGAQDALKGQMMRGGGQDVVTGLSQADQAYRMAKVLEQAQGGAVNGQAGAGIFTPAQLNRAAVMNARKFGGNRPFQVLGDAAQEVMPSVIPDSGTAGRLAQMALPATLGGSAALADSAGYDNTAKGLTLAAILAAGGSKTGQKVLNKALFERGAKSRAVGALIRKHRGLFGSASIPLMLEAQQ